MPTAYLAPVDLEDVLQEELGSEVIARYGRLFLTEKEVPSLWAQQIWYEGEILPFSSISTAARQLKERNKLWAHYPYHSLRRAQLITEQLPYFSPKPLSFPSPLPTAPLGSWTLLDPHTLFAARRTSSPFPLGELHFQETKIPPSRAYLKLWELFTRLQTYPAKNARCLELGASPGSWTWVLQQLGAEVIAVDRAPLAPHIASLPRVTTVQRDAFSLNPASFSNIEWLFSDLICYPDKLFTWIEPWLEQKVNLVCTLKFQGKMDFSIIKKFATIPGSALLHLFHNKHELTWYRLL